MNTISSNKDLFGLVRQEFTLAAGNPKAILIFTAFLPQFVEPNSNMDLQFFILGDSLPGIRDGSDINLRRYWSLLEALVFQPSNG